MLPQRLGRAMLFQSDVFEFALHLNMLSFSTIVAKENVQG